MGLIDAFVHAHNNHRRNIENPRNIGICMKGRIRFMTAITPACAHAYHVTGLTRHIPAVQNQRFRLPSAKAKYPHLPNVRTTTRERGNDFQGRAIYTDGVLALPMVKHLLDGVLFWSSRQKLILHFQVPKLIPKTLLKCRPWLRPCSFLDPMVQLP